MDTIEVLVPKSLEPSARGQITSVSPVIRLVEFNNDGDAPDARSPQVLLRWGWEAAAIDTMLERHPSIRWIQMPSAGVERLYSQIKGYSGVVTNAAGIYAEPIAEWGITMMLMHAKQLGALMENFRKRQWTAGDSDELGGKTVGIIGAGGIGSAVARKAKGMGMHTVGLRASGRASDDYDEMFGPNGLKEVLSRSHYVIICTPLTTSTEGMFGETELRAMRQDGVLLNIARGRIVQTDALMKALSERWLAAAYLDVTDPEPLPEDHPLWTLPNVFITPHMSGRSPNSERRVMDLFCENLRRWIASEPLLNVVDLERGY